MNSRAPSSSASLYASNQEAAPLGPVFKAVASISAERWNRGAFVAHRCLQRGNQSSSSFAALCQSSRTPIALNNNPRASKNLNTRMSISPCRSEAQAGKPSSEWRCAITAALFSRRRRSSTCSRRLCASASRRRCSASLSRLSTASRRRSARAATCHASFSARRCSSSASRRLAASNISKRSRESRCFRSSNSIIGMLNEEKEEVAPSSPNS
mmetsp:Transcript_7532/g.12327  ORF Transcript_7532/g.12327 Transcript_7532/m.12327 type:complete len:212 (-) Transcript_7532:451-1086(-)